MDKPTSLTGRMAFLLGVPMLLASAGDLHAQGMSFSVYTDTSQTSSALYMYTTVSDNSWGCSHYGYMTSATLYSPSGRSAVSQTSGLYASTSLNFDAEYGDYTAATTGNYSCSCIHGGTAGFGSSQPVFVQRPTSLNMYNSGALSGTPSQCQVAPRYYNFRDYQVMDQRNPPQAILKAMSMTEAFTTPTNTCNVNFVTGSTTTGSSGQFRDTFFMCGNVPACNNGGSCTVVRNQTWSADASQVGQYTLTYTCSNVTITP